jgi:hypothetical protein
MEHAIPFDIFYLSKKNVADQGHTEQEALQNKKKCLKEHYQLLIEFTPRDHKLNYLDIEVDALFKKFLCCRLMK